MTENWLEEHPAAQWHDLLLDSKDITDFLNDFTMMIADHLAGDGDEVWCAVTLLRERKSTCVASSSDRAAALDEIQYDFGDGPCLTAAREHRIIHVSDMRLENRWPDYKDAAAANGIISVLGLPFELEEGARAGLNVYSDQPDKYDDAAIKHVHREVLIASKALQLAVHMARDREKAADMESAMRSRTTIDLAVGIIMGQNKCSQDEAFNVLKTASSSRNVKIRDLAADIVAGIGQGPAKTHFDG
ncbi:GAF and ANTAR domain-containing protein [Arthrobacter sp. Marseille-P9274]|uniref:GAF and ANTAR domain-containing protein n=1 Tax=Arthrobacter sp. Marseille-P9274 TaxID=2866572 RepID=UPI0021C8D15A|nr:GAF and ANTAR domain-containing protein [Arthrobacter sp. Marseille-P9274]